ncbi:hypothetical protein SK128_014337, partial [Halocaridina rubra]
YKPQSVSEVYNYKLITSKTKMFNGLRSASPSPCPSPVRELMANMRMNGCPKRDKYKTMIESQDPIISRGRLTMSGGFTDFRPRTFPVEKNDSLECDDGTPSVSSSSRSASCDSIDPIIDNPLAKSNRGFVKIPRKAFRSVIHHLSPRLSKKILNEEKKYENIAPQNPMWPNVMTTYARGVSTTPVQSLQTPVMPSLTAMKAQAILDEKKQIRNALNMLKEEAHKKQMTRNDSSCLSSSFDSDHHDFIDQVNYIDIQHKKSSNEHAESIYNYDLQESEAISASDVFPVNPQIQINEGTISNTEESIDGSFYDEPLFDALELELVPTLTPEELANRGITEVRNVHLSREYIILETGPPTDSIFV